MLLRTLAVRSRAALGILLLPLAACGPAVDAEETTASILADSAARSAAAAATASDGQPVRWAGVAEGGFDGDSLYFSVVGGEVRDVEFRGYWRCTSSTSSFKETKPMDVGHVPGSFAVAADGTFGEEKREPYLLWTLAGRFTGPDAASGTIRIEYATDCDTYELKWSAAPLGG